LTHRDHAHLGAVGVFHGHVALARAVVPDQHGAKPDGDALVRQTRHPIGHLGPHPGGHRLAIQQDGRHQCRKCRSPVTTMASPTSSATAITSPSLTELPGCTTAVTPAAARTSNPSGNGKKASLAPAPPLAFSPALRTAISAATTRDCWPAPTPTACPSFTIAMALEVVRPHTRQARTRSRHSSSVGWRDVTTVHSTRGDTNSSMSWTSTLAPRLRSWRVARSGA